MNALPSNTENCQPRIPCCRVGGSVSFSSRDLVFNIPHLNEMSQDEINNQHLSQEELDNIRVDCRNLISAMESGGQIPFDDEQDFRGLERKTRQASFATNTLRDEIYDAVYALQKIRQFAGVDPSDAIAKLSSQLSRASAESARLVAEQDAQAVANELRPSCIPAPPPPPPSSKRTTSKSSRPDTPFYHGMRKRTMTTTFRSKNHKTQ